MQHFDEMAEKITFCRRELPINFSLVVLLLMCMVLVSVARVTLASGVGWFIKKG